MANPEHLKILKHGVKKWNEWRQTNPLAAPSLVGANLSGADLHRANLSDADLSDADLSGARLVGANLIGANLNGASLVGANLIDADLHHAGLVGANLIDANLHSANFTRANLHSANFTRAGLSGANLMSAFLGFTVFVDVDLSEVGGLEGVTQLGPSTIGIDTIYKSRGKIPHVFLRSAGIPDNFIEYVGSLTGMAFEYYSCFISYSTKDEEFAKRLYSDLQTQGVRCWFAPEDFKIGQRMRPGIDEAIRIHDKLLLVLSDSSVKSAWVEKEVETAFEKERREEKTVLFPVRLDDAVMKTDVAWAADIRRTRHIGDFKEWQNHADYKKAFDRLLRDLKADKPRKEQD